jgi:NADH dehydrogenase FAD-containing subunit
MVAPVAIQEGAAAAGNIIRQLRGEAPQPFRYRDQGMMVTSSTRSDRVWVQESSTGLSGFLTKRPVFSMKMVPAQREGGDFYPYGSCDIILLSEHEGIYRLSNS